jgi:hypothetical protein
MTGRHRLTTGQPLGPPRPDLIHRRRLSQRGKLGDLRRDHIEPARQRLKITHARHLIDGIDKTGPQLTQ